MLFNTNRTCSVPLHILLTDLVEAQGGSSELIRLLNTVGAIASADTHQRYVQYQVERKYKKGILSELEMDRFTVVSIDNIDFLQRHAFVYCGDQSRSWHGTTVQVVQPILTETEQSTHAETSSDPTVNAEIESSTIETGPVRKRAIHPSPDCSPCSRSPLPKKTIRRARTSKETRSSHFYNSTSSPPRRTLFSPANPLQGISTNHYSALRDNHTINHFHISNIENTELNDLQLACFIYMLFTSAPNSYDSSEYSSLPVFLSHVFPATVLPSKYMYLDVLDQNADCKETINEVVSRLHEQFCVGTIRKHLIVAGDAKTYLHLQALKLDYGEELSWLLPFPGDFHILKNLQPVLSTLLKIFC